MRRALIVVTILGISGAWLFMRPSAMQGYKPLPWIPEDSEWLKPQPENTTTPDKNPILSRRAKRQADSVLDSTIRTSNLHEENEANEALADRKFYGNFYPNLDGQTGVRDAPADPFP